MEKKTLLKRMCWFQPFSGFPLKVVCSSLSQVSPDPGDIVLIDEQY